MLLLGPMQPNRKRNSTRLSKEREEISATKPTSAVGTFDILDGFAYIVTFRDQLSLDAHQTI